MMKYNYYIAYQYECSNPSSQLFSPAMIVQYGDCIYDNPKKIDSEQDMSDLKSKIAERIKMYKPDGYVLNLIILNLQFLNKEE